MRQSHASTVGGVIADSSLERGGRPSRGAPFLLGPTAVRRVTRPLSYPPVRGLQKRPNRARRLGDVGQELGQGVPHRQRAAAPGLGRQHVVDERAAMQNALLLTPERLDLRAAATSERGMFVGAVAEPRRSIPPLR